jgi:hypothetical protein
LQFRIGCLIKPGFVDKSELSHKRENSYIRECELIIHQVAFQNQPVFQLPQKLLSLVAVKLLRVSRVPVGIFILVEVSLEDKVVLLYEGVDLCRHVFPPPIIRVVAGKRPAHDLYAFINHTAIGQ